VVESREGRIIGWNDGTICVYNCADGNLHQFGSRLGLPDIILGLKVERKHMEFIDDHLFVLHYKEDNSGRYCISEFHLSKKATAWVKLRVHECDPSLYDPPEEHNRLSLLACNEFLLVHSDKDDRVSLYNLSTSMWRNLPDLKLSTSQYMVMCEINWNILH